MLFALKLKLSALPGLMVNFEPHLSSFSEQEEPDMDRAMAVLFSQIALCVIDR